MSEQQPAPEPQPTAAEPQQDSPEMSSAQKRINTLYGQAQQAKEQAAQFEAANTELRTQLATLQEKLSLIEARSPVTPDPFQPQQPAVQQSSGQDTEELINKAVDRAVGPFIATQQQQQQAAQLQAVQQQSFLRAAGEYPELSDRASGLHSVADTIWKNDAHLRQHPDGPYLAAMMARGAMVPGTQAVPADTKIAAGQPPAQAGVPVPGGAPESVETLSAEHDAVLAELGRTASAVKQRELYTKAYHLKERIATLAEKQK